jgi:hypothetical protein
MDSDSDHFRLKDLPKELLGELTAFLNTEAMLRLWSSGDRFLQSLLALPNVMRVLRVHRVQKDVALWNAAFDVLDRFPHLVHLYVYVRNNLMSADRPVLSFTANDLPRSIRVLQLWVGNAEEIFCNPNYNPENPDSGPPFINVASILPNLATLDLDGNQKINDAFFLETKLPDTLSKVHLNQNHLIHQQTLAKLPESITDISLATVVMEPPYLPMSPTIEIFSVRNRSTAGPFPALFEFLPPHLKHLMTSTKSDLNSSQVVLLPTTLTVLEMSAASLSDIHSLQRLTNLTKLSINCPNAPADVSKHLPRGLKRLAFRRYQHFDDNFWMGLPPGLETLSAIMTSLYRYRRNPGVAQNAGTSMTEACIPFIPQRLTNLDLGGILGNIKPESFALLPRKLTRLRVNRIDAEGMEGLPSSLTSIDIEETNLDAKFAVSLPEKLSRLKIASVITIDPEALSSLPSQLTELRLENSRVRREATLIFEQEWAALLPSSLRRLCLRVSNNIGDEFFNLLNIPLLAHLELLGPNTQFTDVCIPLLPRRLTWLELDGCDGFSLSPTNLSSLPRQLTWFFMNLRNPEGRVLKDKSEVDPYLPPSLSNHNIPTQQRPPHRLGYDWNI